MNKSINILDKEYLQWVKNLCGRYRQSQIKAAVKVNVEQLKFNWLLGRDIVELHVEERWGESVITQLSKDLREAIPNAAGLSKSNIYYCRKFYLLYKDALKTFHQLGGKNETELFHQVGGIFEVPWRHHCLIMDKVKDDIDKALFYVHQTVENGWSRSMLLNFIKDPYNFAFTGITGRYNERLLKDALLNNITRFLIELGTGFAYVGKEYRLEIGETENFIDLLFYNLSLSCYVVVEVKIGKFAFADIGQLGGYVVACNHLLRKEGRDNPTIGLLICKEKDRIQAQYALESSSQPLGISEYDLEKFYPEKVEGTMPTIEEIEAKLRDN